MIHSYNGWQQVGKDVNIRGAQITDFIKSENLLVDLEAILIMGCGGTAVAKSVAKQGSWMHSKSEDGITTTNLNLYDGADVGNSLTDKQRKTAGKLFATSE